MFFHSLNMYTCQMHVFHEAHTKNALIIIKLLINCKTICRKAKFGYRVDEN